MDKDSSHKIFGRFFRDSQAPGTFPGLEGSIFLSEQIKKISMEKHVPEYKKV
jgi:hypothetical protein